MRHPLRLFAVAGYALTVLALGCACALISSAQDTAATFGMRTNEVARNL